MNMLTQAQLATLKAAIVADNTLNSQPNNSDGNENISVALDALASPDYYVWRTSVLTQDLFSDPAFDWTRVDNLSVGKARIVEWLQMAGTLNPSQANVRAGFSAAFSAAGDVATLAAILGACKRKATKGEKIFATGNGIIANPSVMAVEGTLSAQDINTARNLP